MLVRKCYDFMSYNVQCINNKKTFHKQNKPKVGTGGGPTR